jgi:predicted nucleic acid-binding protein
MPGRALVLDANILVRAVLGKRVRKVIETYAGEVSFFIPEVAYEEAEERLPALLLKRGGDPEKALSFLRSLAHLVEPIGREIYGEFEAEARERLGDRDPEDWPILASALAVGCPIWTEDTDFFGCGVPTWTSNRVGCFCAIRKNDVLRRRFGRLRSAASAGASPNKKGRPVLAERTAKGEISYYRRP